MNGRARFVLAQAIIVVVSVVLPSLPGRADVAAYRYVDYFLYAREGSTVVRWSCDATREVYDRSTCAAAPTRVPAAKYYAALQRRFAEGTQPVEARLTDLHARLDQTDLRLLEILNSANDPLDARLKPAMDEATARLLAAAPALQEQRDQVARLAAEAARNPSPDLGVQLVAARRDLAEATLAFEGLAADAAAKRHAFVEANATLIDPVVYQALVGQRRELATRIEDASYHLSRECARVVAAERTIAMIEDGGPTWVQSRDHPDSFRNGEVLAAMHPLTDELDLIERTFQTVGAVGARQVQVEVTRSERIDWFKCRFRQRGSSDCQVLQVTTPHGDRIRTTNWYPHRWSDAAAAAAIFAVDPRGTWTFDILWECSAVPEVEEAPDCSIEVASEASLARRN